MNRLVMAMLIVLAGVAAGQERPDRGLPRSEPAAAGMNAERLEEITAAMRQFVAERQIAGAVTLVARQGKIVHLSAVGQADLEERRPMSEDTLFVIASMTKPVTATALMILQDEGKLSVDDPVAKYLPEFEQAKLATASAEGRKSAAQPAGRDPSRPITIQDVITHTSGLAGDQRTERTLEDTVAAIVKRPLAFDPGTKWQYSPGLNVCGRIIEVVSKMPFDQFLETRIFQPLGMLDTTFRPSDEQRKRLARIYRVNQDGELEVASHWLADDWKERAPNPSGGLHSTALDMCRFYQMVLNGGQLGGKRILSPQAVTQMTTVQSGEVKTGFTDGNGWGLGWCVVRRPQGITQMLLPGTFGHGGAFGTQGWVDPQRQMIFVLMIQRIGLPNSVASDLRRVLQEKGVEALEKAD